MSAIPYSIAKRISDELVWPKKFYWVLLEVLIQCNGLGFALSKVRTEKIIKKTIKEYHNKRYSKDKPKNTPTVKSESAYFMFLHIVYRTYAFEKAFEFIRVKDVRRGQPTNGIPGYGLSDTTVKRTLNWLSPPHSDYFVKLNFHKKGQKIITPLYGINLPVFLELIQVWWIASIVKQEREKDDYEFFPNRKPSNLMLRGRCMLQCCIDFSSEYKDAFKFLTRKRKPIGNVELFIRQFKKYLPKRSLNSEFEYNLNECKKIRNLRNAYNKYLEEGEGYEYHLSF